MITSQDNLENNSIINSNPYPHPLIGEHQRTIVGDIAVINFPDGSTAIEQIDENSLMNMRRHHKENLALILNENEIRDIGGTLKEAVDDDIDSQSAFFEAVSNLVRLMGIDLTSQTDKDDLPFKGASAVYSPRTFETLQSLLASIRSSLYKSSGMVDSCIVGDPTDQLNDTASRMKDWFNYYFDYVYEDFRKEAMQTAAWAFVAGSIYKKVFTCPILKRPISESIPVEDFIVNNVYSSHLKASRRTHRLRLTEKEFKTYVMMGLYREDRKSVV